MSSVWNKGEFAKYYSEMTDDQLKDIYKWFKQQISLIREIERHRKLNSESMS